MSEKTNLRVPEVIINSKIDPRLAVLIPTCRDTLQEMHLDATLTALAMQSILPHRVYIRDEGKIEMFRHSGTRMLWNLLASKGIKTIYLRATKRKGIALARKELFDALQDETLILSLDDDIVMEQDAIANLIAVLESDSSLGFVQGEKINLDPSRGHLNNVNKVCGQTGQPKEPFPIYFGTTAFLLFRSEVIQTIQWDIVMKFCTENLGGEDIAISLMISDKFKCLGVPTARCWHISTSDSKRWSWDLSLDLLWLELLRGAISDECLRNALPHLKEFLE